LLTTSPGLPVWTKGAWDVPCTIWQWPEDYGTQAPEVSGNAHTRCLDLKSARLIGIIDAEPRVPFSKFVFRNRRKKRLNQLICAGAVRFVYKDTNCVEIAHGRPWSRNNVTLKCALDPIVLQNLFDHLRFSGSSHGDHFQRLVFGEIFFVRHFAPPFRNRVNLYALRRQSALHRFDGQSRVPNTPAFPQA